MCALLRNNRWRASLRFSAPKTSEVNRLSRNAELNQVKGKERKEKKERKKEIPSSRYVRYAVHTSAFYFIFTRTSTVIWTGLSFISICGAEPWALWLSVLRRNLEPQSFLPLYRLSPWLLPVTRSREGEKKKKRRSFSSQRSEQRLKLRQ